MPDTYTTEELEALRDRIEREIGKRGGDRKPQHSNQLDAVPQMNGCDFERWIKEQGRKYG